MSTMVQDILITLFDRMGDEFVSNIPSVDVEILLVSLTAGMCWQADPTIYGHTGYPMRGAFLVKIDRTFEKWLPQYRTCPPRRFLFRSNSDILAQYFSIVLKVDRNLRVAKTYFSDNIFNSLKFSFFSTQKIPSCRCIKKQILNFNGGTLWMRRGRYICLHRLSCDSDTTTIFNG